MSLTKTDIEYLDFHWGFMTGCRHDKTVCACADNCWAKDIAHRFHRSFEPILHPEKLTDPLRVKRPSVIGVCFTGDLMGDWVDPKTLVDVSSHPVFGENLIHGKFWELSCIVSDVLFCSPQHRFFFLTKVPHNYRKWREFTDNAWLGVTITSNKNEQYPLREMANISGHKWVSFEPLLDWGTSNPDVVSIALKMAGIDWVVIGALTGPKSQMVEANKQYPALTLMPYRRQWSLQPKPEWIREIVEACDKAYIPVWLKDNLKPLFIEETAHDWETWAINVDGDLRQERPF